ncbi:MAG: DUF2268 domain-containing protein [Hyphomonas sp.]|nr:DUF2268 domain-containing protein [Hyphomonas sp.]
MAIKHFLLPGLVGILSILIFAASPMALAQPVNPSAATIDTSDADRFAALFEETDGAPTAMQLEVEYLANSGPGLALMAQTRFRGAEQLAGAIEADPGKYDRAISVCLPLAKSAQDDLRATYAKLHELLPEYDLPQVYAVFGAGTSAGTAAPGVQVLGLEVICAVKYTDDEINETFRYFFAHESVHAFQGMPSERVIAIDPLLVASIYEGMADYIAMTITGHAPDVARDEWARENSDMVWSQFAADRKVLQESAARGETLATLSPVARDAFRRWHFNAGIAPSGWPDEAGYWIGRQIVTAYVERSANKDLAIRELLNLQNPIEVLQASGLAARLNTRSNTEENSND